MGKAQTQEDFEQLLREIDEGELDDMVEESLAGEDTEPPKEEPKEEPKKEPKKQPKKKAGEKKEAPKEEDSGQGANGGG